MTDAHMLDQTIHKASFWSAIVLILAGALSPFFPLDAPAGSFADRMQWYASNVEIAEQLFQLLNPSLAYSLFTSFDYLGFWMYGVLGLLVGLTLSAKIAGASLGVHAGPEFLPLDADELRRMELESISPFPAEIVRKGESENWERVLYKGDFVVSAFAASPAVIEINEPFPYDEFVLVLKGEVTLTNIDGGTQTYKPGDTFLVPKGWLGT